MAHDPDKCTYITPTTVNPDAKFFLADEVWNRIVTIYRERDDIQENENEYRKTLNRWDLRSHWKVKLLSEKQLKDACAAWGINPNSLELEETTLDFCTLNHRVVRIEYALYLIISNSVSGVFWQENICKQHANCLDEYREKVKNLLAECCDNYEVAMLKTEYFSHMMRDLNQHCYYRTSQKKAVSNKIKREDFERDGTISIHDYWLVARQYALNLYNVHDEQQKNYAPGEEIPRGIAQIFWMVGSIDKYFEQMKYCQRYHRRKLAWSLSFMMEKKGFGEAKSFIMGNVMSDKTNFLTLRRRMISSAPPAPRVAENVRITQQTRALPSTSSGTSSQAKPPTTQKPSSESSSANHIGHAPVQDARNYLSGLPGYTMSAPSTSNIRSGPSVATSIAPQNAIHQNFNAPSTSSRKRGALPGGQSHDSGPQPKDPRQAQQSANSQSASSAASTSRSVATSVLTPQSLLPTSSGPFAQAVFPTAQLTPSAGSSSATPNGHAPAQLHVQQSANGRSTSLSEPTASRVAPSVLASQPIPAILSTNSGPSSQAEPRTARLAPSAVAASATQTFRGPAQVQVPPSSLSGSLPSTTAATSTAVNRPVQALPVPTAPQSAIPPNANIPPQPNVPRRQNGLNAAQRAANAQVSRECVICSGTREDNNEKTGPLFVYECDDNRCAHIYLYHNPCIGDWFQKCFACRKRYGIRRN